MSLQKIKTFGLQNLNPAESLQQMVSAYTEYLTIAKLERTKRRDIEAWEKEAITRINAQRDLVITYLERSFDERAENFRALFGVVDNALISGDNEQLALALNSITEIAKSSPFKNLANLTSVRAALNDPNLVDILLLNVLYRSEPTTPKYVYQLQSLQKFPIF